MAAELENWPGTPSGDKDLPQYEVPGGAPQWNEATKLSQRPRRPDSSVCSRAGLKPSMRVRRASTNRRPSSAVPAAVGPPEFTFYKGHGDSTVHLSFNLPPYLACMYT